MSRDEERLDASATRDVPWATDSDSDSEPAAARALVAMFPSLPSSRAWLLYDSLLRAVVRARGPAAASRRRVLAAQIPGVVAMMWDHPVVRTHVGSLLAMLVDPTLVEPPPGFPARAPCPPVDRDRRMKATVPSNSSGSSCFCDVVLVAMFLATQGYDEVLYREPFERGWRDKIVYDDNLVGLDWLEKLREEATSSPCFIQHQKQGADESLAVALTLEKSEEMQALLVDRIVRPMRLMVSVDILQCEANALGKVISELREGLLECGFMGQLFGQEDSEELFTGILRIGEWDALFLPIVRLTHENTFSGTVGGYDLSKTVPKHVVVDLDPVHAILEFPTEPRGEGEPLQRLLDSSYFRPVESWEELNESYLKYIWEVAPELKGKTKSDFLSVNATVRTVSQWQLLRVPDPFAFSLRRLTYERGVVVRNENRVLLPKDGIIEIPPPATDLRYRIFAIACQFGEADRGHYVLYFRCSGSSDSDSWYYYNDTGGPELIAVNMREEEREIFISKNAYLFWAERIA